MKIVKKKVSELIPYVNNPRKNDEAVDKVASSIKNYGFKVPIVIDENNEVITGHTRLKAAKKLQLSDVPCIVASDLTPAQIKAFRIADNKVSEFSGWDFDILKNEILELKELDYEIENTGFDIDEIDELFPMDYSDKEEVEDEVPEVNKTPFIKRGDIITLGNHRFMCGDSTSKEDVSKMMMGEVADMIHTDPPYNIDYGASKNPRHKIRSIKNDKLNKSEWEIFCNKLYDVFDEFNKGDVYMWGASGPEGMKMRLWLYQRGYNWSATIIWNKDSLVLSPAKYQRKYEPCFYGWKDKSSFVGDRKQVEVWDFKRPRNSKLHPTMKPIEVCEKGIVNSSKTKDKVLDLFLGSGSTLIACEKTGRHCRGMELEEHYCDVIIKRWLDYSGQQTVEINGKEVYNEFTSHVEGDKND